MPPEHFILSGGLHMLRRAPRDCCEEWVWQQLLLVLVLLFLRGVRHSLSSAAGRSEGVLTKRTKKGIPYLGVKQCFRKARV
eukprot:5087467-Amphidinium_carterae.1